MGVRSSKTADRLSIRAPGVPAPIDARKPCLDGNAASAWSLAAGTPGLVARVPARGGIARSSGKYRFEEA